jgi:hypothetical protein
VGWIQLLVESKQEPTMLTVVIEVGAVVRKIGLDQKNRQPPNMNPAVFTKKTAGLKKPGPASSPVF